MRALSLAVLLTLVLGAPVALAQKVTQSPPKVRVTLAPGHAKLVVRRTWKNAGGDDLLLKSFSIPRGGALSGLKAKLGAGWVRPRMMPSDAAQKLFDGTGPHGGNALLLTGSRSNNFTLTVAPFAKSSTKSIEYTVHLPTVYEEGRHVLYNPGDVTALTGAGKVLIDGVDAAVARSDNEDIVGEQLQLVHRSSKPLSGALAFVELGEKRRALRYRLHAAAKLGRAPKKAAVVLLLDGSRSMSETQADGMVAAARAYLTHLDDAKVDVIVFDRFATSVFGKLVKADRAEGKLATLSIAPQNGSNVPAALALANKRLEAAPKGAPKRIVLFTDTLTKASLDVADIGLADAGGLLHVAVVDDVSYELNRDDLHPWAPHVAKTGGVVWKAPARPSAKLGELAETFEELVRPVRFHRVNLRVPAAESLQSVAGTLQEGRGLSGLSMAADVDPRVRFTGVLWQKQTDVTLHPSASETRLWEGLVLGSNMAKELTDDETRRLGMKAKVVTDQTSFVFATKGSRQVLRGIGLAGFSSSCCGGCRMGIARAATPPFPEPEVWLRTQLGKAHARCAGGDQTMKVHIGTTKDEIADVRIQTADAKLAACMDGEAWKLQLPVGFSGRKLRAQLAVSLP